jgi:hypothetical protein
MQFGFIPWFSSSVVNVVSGLGLTWQPAFGIILVLYFYSHYFFASGAAHIGAMYTAFLAVARACGTPAMLAALALGQVSVNLTVTFLFTRLHKHTSSSSCTSAEFPQVPPSLPEPAIMAKPPHVRIRHAGVSGVDH